MTRRNNFAYLDGWDAGVEEIPLADNPYKSIRLRADWERGWNEAHDLQPIGDDEETMQAPDDSPLPHTH